MVGVRHRIGGYRVIAPIGAGGFSTVYRALDEETGQEMAIKVLAENHSLVPDTRRRFEEEMGLLSTVRSPSIAKISKVGVTDAGQPFMVLELADRGDLRRRLEEVRSDHRVLNREDLTILARHLHDSLRTLHDMEIIHRDVSPGNILIRSHRPDDGTLTRHPAGVTLLEPGEKLLLTDLGHAKDMIIASGFTAGGGTRGFASPEQQDDVTVVDHRADIFAATAILEWAAVDGEYADGLEPFFDVGLAAEPDDRFDSMAEWHRTFLGTMVSAEAKRLGHHPGRIARLFRRTGPAETMPESGRTQDTNQTNQTKQLAPKRSSANGASVSQKVVQPPNAPGATGIVRPPPPESNLRFIVPPPEGDGLRIVAKPSNGSNPSVGNGRGAGNGRTVGSLSHKGKPLATDKQNRVATATSVSNFGEYVYGNDNTPTAGKDTAAHKPKKRSKKRRRLVMSGGALAVAAIAAVGIAQELGNSSSPFGLLTAAGGADEDLDSIPAAVPMEDQSGAAGLIDQPPELVVTTEPATPSRTEQAAPSSNIEAFSAAPRADIAVPVDGTEIARDLTVQGTASRLDDSDTVKLSIRNLDTRLYWNAESQSFETGRTVLELAVTRGVGGTPKWSATVPAEQLEPGWYTIQAWITGEGSAVNPQDDSHRVVVPRSLLDD